MYICTCRKAGYVAELLGGASMKFPCLVDKRFCKTPIKVSIDTDELNEDGELADAYTVNTKCNLQMGAKASFTKDKEKIELAGIALFPGDLCPKIPVIASGSVTINGKSYGINKGRKNLNPDGTVNYTTLELV